MKEFLLRNREIVDLLEDRSTILVLENQMPGENMRGRNSISKRENTCIEEIENMREREREGTSASFVAKLGYLGIMMSELNIRVAQQPKSNKSRTYESYNYDKINLF